jgi:membrane protease YdiL (CAAX protease family)
MKVFNANLNNIFLYLKKYYLGLILFTFLITVLEFFFKTKIRLNCGSSLEFELKKFISAILIAPILEELVFRNGLSYKKNEFLISLIFSIIAFIYWYYPIDEVIQKEVYIFLFYLLIHILMFFINFKEKNLFSIYSSSIFFGLVHINNYDSCNSSELLIVVNTIPQMISGYCLAKLRLKSGVVYSMILHMIINLIAFGIGFAMH